MVQDPLLQQYCARHNHKPRPFLYSPVRICANIMFYQFASLLNQRSPEQTSKLIWLLFQDTSQYDNFCGCFGGWRSVKSEALSGEISVTRPQGPLGVQMPCVNCHGYPVFRAWRLGTIYMMCNYFAWGSYVHLQICVHTEISPNSKS